jgi:hypothetical protein
MAIESGYWETSNTARTRADKIKTLSDVELAELLRYTNDCPEGKIIDCASHDSCTDCWVAWLRETVPEGD